MSQKDVPKFVEFCTLARHICPGGPTKKIPPKVIEKENPDLVFLDVEMPFGNGFDLLDSLDQINFEVIFVTAFSHYAVQALNLSASYYILKPVDIDELTNATVAAGMIL